MEPNFLSLNAEQAGARSLLAIEGWIEKVFDLMTRNASLPTASVALVGVIVAYLSYRHGVNSKKRELDARDRELALAEKKHAHALIFPPAVRLRWVKGTHEKTLSTRFHVLVANNSNRKISIAEIYYRMGSSRKVRLSEVRAIIGAKRMPPFQVPLEPTQQCEIIFDTEDVWLEPSGTTFARLYDAYRQIYKSDVTVVLTTGEFTSVHLPEDLIQLLINKSGSFVLRLLSRFRKENNYFWR
jgi:hypothetical protein